MTKFTFKLLILLFTSSVFSSSVFASLITDDLTPDTYITYEGYDWTWASPVNTSIYKGTDPTHNEYVTNVFEDPSFHAGWMFIEGSELKELFLQLTLADFQRNGEIVQSVAYWNSDFVHVDISDFESGSKSGVKSAKESLVENYETFYVRASLPEAAQVPEPTTLFIFAAGLVGFALRKRNAK